MHREKLGTKADVCEPCRRAWDGFWSEALHLGVGGDAGFLGQKLEKCDPWNRLPPLFPYGHSIQWSLTGSIGPTGE